jgi:hypothetical protein
MPTAKLREAVGLFNSMDDLQDAVRDLEVRSFPREFISIAGGPATRPEKAADDPDTPRSAPVRTEEKALGASALIGAGIYAGAAAMIFAAGAAPLSVILGCLGGGAAGGLVAGMIGRHASRDIAARIRNGGLLLWVRTPDAKRERAALEILRAHGARHVRIHDYVP